MTVMDRSLRTVFLLSLVMTALLAAPAAHAALTVTSASLADGSTVPEGTVFTMDVTVSQTGSLVNLGARTWRSVAVLANGNPLQCVNIIDSLGVSASATRTFNVAAPATAGTFSITVIAHNNDTCSGSTVSPSFAASSSLTVDPLPASPITLVGVQTALDGFEGNAPGITVAVPAGNVDDVLIALVTTDGPTDLAPVDTSAWTLLDVGPTTGGLTGDLAQATVGVWYRVADGTEPASYSFIWTTDGGGVISQQSTAALFRYSGVDVNAPINAFAAANGLTGNPIAPDVTTTVDGAMILRMYGSDSIAIPGFFPTGTGPSDTSATVTTNPAPHGLFSIISDSTSLFESVSNAAAEALQLGGAGATGTARFGFVSTPQQWRAFTLALAPAIDLELTKTESIDPVVAGSGAGNLIHTVTLTNNGASTATNITVEDVLTLPTGVTASVSPTTGSWAAPVWTIPSLAAGASTTLVITITAGPAAIAGDVISDTATITGADQSLINTSDDTASVATTIATSADVSVTKTDSPDPVTAGTNLTWTITVTNSGPSNAAAVTLADTLPAGTTFVSMSSVAGWSCSTPPVGNSGAISCTNAVFAPGSAVFTLVALVSPSTAAASTITNTATATLSTPDPDAPDRTAQSTTTVSASADLSLTKTDSPDPVTPGTQLQYTITVNNAGPSNAAGASWTDTLPAGTTFVSMTAVAGWSCTTPLVGSGGTITCNNSSVAPGGSMFVLTVLVSPSATPTTVITNSATVSSTTTDPVPNQTGTTQTTVGSGSATLSVTKTANQNPVNAGSQLQYTINVTNPGPSAAAAATLSDTLPAGTTFVSMPAVAGWNCTTPPVGSGGTVSCTNASFAPGAASFTLTVAISASATGGSSISNTAAVSSNTGGGNSDTEAVTVAAPSAVSATKTVSGIFYQGENITYTITLNNNGAGIQSDNPGPEFTDVLPSTLALVSASASSGTAVATVGTSTVTWNGSILPGVPVTITITATIRSSTPTGTTISNQGGLAFDADGNGTNEATGVTDDPGVAGSANPTNFVVAAIEAIPALDARALAILAAVLAMCAALTLRPKV